MINNNTEQPIGHPIENWVECALPEHRSMYGNYCNVVPLNPNTHALDLFNAYSTDPENTIENTTKNGIEKTTHNHWTYLPYGPFQDFNAFESWLNTSCRGADPLFYAIINIQTQKAVGLASYLRIKPAIGVVEIGHIHFSPLMQRTPLGTEAMYLMMRHIFDELSYRRYEWKCDSLNASSCAAAQRLGFHFEGIFRQAAIYKSRNRDTNWFSIVDKEWPTLKNAFHEWLKPSNFDSKGKQIKRLKITL